MAEVAPVNHEDVDPSTAQADRLAKARAARERRVEERRAAREAEFLAAMAEPVAGQRPTVLDVAISEVRFDPRYQTSARYDDARARKIAREFDWHQCKPISLNRRPEDPERMLWCYDGHHRVSAATYRFGDEARLNAQLVEVPYEEEVRLFAVQHANEKTISRVLQHNALLEHRDEQALAIQALLGRHRLELGKHARQRMVGADTFLKTYDKFGPDVLEPVLELLLNRWDGLAESLEAHIIKGFCIFLFRRRDDPNFGMDKFTQRLGETSLTDLENSARDYPGLNKNQQVSAALTYAYNYGRRDRISEWNPKGEQV